MEKLFPDFIVNIPKSEFIVAGIFFLPIIIDFKDGIPFPNFTLTVNFASRSHCDHDEKKSIAYSVGFWFYDTEVFNFEFAKFCFPRENIKIEFGKRGTYKL